MLLKYYSIWPDLIFAEVFAHLAQELCDEWLVLLGKCHAPQCWAWWIALEPCTTWISEAFHAGMVRTGGYLSWFLLEGCVSSSKAPKLCDEMGLFPAFVFFLAWFLWLIFCWVFAECKKWFRMLTHSVCIYQNLPSWIKLFFEFKPTHSPCFF